MPFTYLIGWSQANAWYIGARWRNGCSPSDLWTTYFTSSKYVAEFRKEHGEPDIIEIDQVFSDKKAALEREIFLLKINRVKERNDFLNKAIGGVFDPLDPVIRAKNSAAQRGKKQSAETIAKRTLWKRGVPHSEAHARAISESLTGKKYDEERKIRMSQAMIGQKRRLGTITSDIGRINIGLAKRGSRHSDVTKSKMSQTRTGRTFKIVTCPHCGKTGGESAMKRWHFIYCKLHKV